MLRGRAEAFGSVFSGTVFILSPAFFAFLEEKDDNVFIVPLPSRSATLYSLVLAGEWSDVVLRWA